MPGEYSVAASSHPLRLPFCSFQPAHCSIRMRRVLSSQKALDGEVSRIWRGRLDHRDERQSQEQDDDTWADDDGAWADDVKQTGENRCRAADRQDD